LAQVGDSIGNALCRRFGGSLCAVQMWGTFMVLD